MTAVRTTATPGQIEQIAGVVRTVLVSSGALYLLLSLATVALAIAVGRGNALARGGAFALVIASLCFGLGSASYTSLGRQVNWTSSIEDASVGLRSQIGQAYGDAMPGSLVGTTGGLTDLQALSYLAGAGLLLSRSSRQHFRRRTSPAPRNGVCQAPDSDEDR
jgi:hypothetical protein